MRLSLLTLSSLATSIVAKNIDSSGFQNLKFNITRGNTFADSSSTNYPRFVKRTDADGSVTMSLDNYSTFYSVTVQVGSQKEELVVLVDTGSSDFWVSSNTNPYCSSSSSSSSSKKFKRFESEAEAIAVLGEETYRNILSVGDQTSSWNVENSKYRNIDDGAFALELFGSSDYDTSAVISDTQNKAATRTSSSAQSSGTMDCAKYGTFDYEASTSFVSNGTDFYILYGDNTFALGTWGYDSVVIGNVSVENLSFAVANESDSSMGVLGIGLEGLETTNVGSLVKNNGYTYPNLPTKLVDDGIINKRVYSLWLNEWSDSTGNVLFGAVDHAKYEGTLSLLPVLNTLASSGYDDPIKLQITLSGITLSSSDDTAEITSTSYAALLDSGTTLTYLPSDIVSSIASSLGATYSSSYGYYMMNCPTSDDVNITYTFQGIDIVVPLTDVVLSVDTAGSVCVLAYGQSDTVILGDSFLRSAYVVYDLDEYQFAIAQAVYTDDENIEVVTSSIPSATTASSYFYTYGVSGSVTATVSNAVISDDIITTQIGNNTSSTRSRSSTTASSTKSSSGNSSGAVVIKVPSYISLMSIIGVICGLSILAV